MLLDQRPGQGEADAQARIRHAGRRALLGEEIEDPFLRFGRDAPPVVGHRGDDDPVLDDDLQVDAAASGVYLAALVRRLSSACVNRVASPRSAIACSGSST